MDALIAPLKTLAENDGLWRPIERTRGAELMAQGDSAKSMFVLLGGLVKLSYLTPDGGERIKSLVADRGIFGPGPGDVEGRYSATTLERCVVVEVPAAWLSARLAESEPLRIARAQFEEWLRARKEARELSLLCESAEIRYLNFLKHQPGLAARLQQADIARFIGVTPIAFSRIKKRLAKG